MEGDWRSRRATREGTTATFLLLLTALLALVMLPTGATGAVFQSPKAQFREGMVKQFDGLSEWFEAKFGHLAKDKRHMVYPQPASLNLLFILMSPWAHLTGWHEERGADARPDPVHVRTAGGYHNHVPGNACLPNVSCCLLD